MSEPRVRVGLGQFSSVITLGVVGVLNEDQRLRVMGTAIDDSELQDLLRRRLLDVALLDERSVVDQSVLRRLRVAGPHTGLIVLRNKVTPTHERQLFAEGVNACLPKDVSNTDLLTTVWLAAHGKYVLQSNDRPGQGGAKVIDVRPLTSRQREVFTLICMGWSNAEIARQLHLEIETVRSHVARVYARLGVKSRRELQGIQLSVTDEKSSPVSSPVSPLVHPFTSFEGRKNR
jgi:DNA-binding NarL/FixJ family response regulator